MVTSFTEPGVRCAGSFPDAILLSRMKSTVVVAIELSSVVATKRSFAAIELFNALQRPR